MKITKKIIGSLLVFFMGIMSMVAETPPQPMRGLQPPPPPPPPPGLSIDNNIYILLIITLFFGAYIVYESKFKKKTPI
ncbi:hypothetical protein [Flavobacterium sp. GP15]|uniref:hypothetical protein n=1 Tax=Flavobacterium sp. GP15 TaxID=2758567 RepID=UPI00165E5E2E|nr:hypothetical protein [Flavobacterium sp. GP15]